MLNASLVIKSITKSAEHNAPAILTAFGAVGSIGTAVLAGKASFSACGKIRDEIDIRVEQVEHGDPTVDPELTRREKIELVWPLYIPAVTTGAVTVGAIVMSHRVSSKRAAAYAAAYVLSEGRLEEYQDKIQEKLGINKEKAARTEIHQETVNKLHVDDGFAFADPTAGLVWIMEAHTGRPFMSTVEKVNWAVNQVNAHINDEKSCKVSTFYDLVGLEHVTTSDYFGWNKSDPLSLDWSTTTSPNGALAVHVFEYINNPVIDPERDASFR